MRMNATEAEAQEKAEGKGTKTTTYKVRKKAAK